MQSSETKVLSPQSPPGSNRPLQSGLGSRIRLFLAPRARTLGLLVPLHLLAFFVLYTATARLWESEFVSIADESAQEQLQTASRELSQIAVAHTQSRTLKHFFEAVLAEHQDIGLMLILPDGRTLGSGRGTSQAELSELRDLIESDAQQRIWLSPEGDRHIMRGLEKVVSTEQCSRCHAQDETLAVASMNIDLTRTLDHLRAQSRRNLALLIAAWALALGATTALVRFSVRRSTRHLEAELEAAEAGETGPPSIRPPGLVFDPNAAELHKSLRDFLARQHLRRAEEATRLAHTDQLATLGQLAAGLAHEIKNPLAGIHGALEILREDASADEDNAELYDEMIKELDRVNDTLQTLLGSARPSPTRLARIDLSGLLREVHRLMEPGLRRKNVRLEMDIAAGPLDAQVDSTKMRQVLINLIQNAAEAMDSEGGTVTLRASGLPQGVGGTILAVQDDGPGIAESQQRKIFDPFFTTKFSGTGLGLAIARSLIEQHGGSLELESSSNEGSTFYILLPSADSSSEDGYVAPDTSEN